MSDSLSEDPTVFIPAILREAAKLISRYDLAGGTATSLLHQSENTIVLVEDKEQPRKLVLRVHSQRLAYHTAPSIASELQWITALHRSSGWSWYSYDLATALSFIEDRPFVPDLIQSWLAGYRKVAALPKKVEDEIPTIMMLRRIAEIAWLGTRRHLPFAQSLGPSFTTDSCHLAEDYLRRFG
jgi:Ser/Thr protein kinase RdoA (MazF antagonist)